MKTQRKYAHCRGAAMVEMALVLTLLLSLVLGTIEYGWLFLTMQRITNAARQGARVASVLNGSDLDGEAAMKALLTDLKDPVTKAPLATVDVDMNDLNVVTATVTLPSSGVRLVNWDALPVPETLHATVKMAKEGALN